MSNKPPALKRELRTIETVALSVAIMSPVLAMALYSGAPAIYVGQAAPLAFVFSGLALALVGGGIVYLCRHFSHAGSVYGLTGLTLGPRAGFVSGWALLACYSVFAVSSAVTAGYFAALLCNDTGIWDGADYFPFTVVALAAVFLIAGRNVKRVGRTLVSIEGVSLILMSIALIIIVIKLFTGTGDHEASLAVFEIPHGVSIHALVLASVFGFAAFAGFEGAASLGEETQNPRRNVPRALVMAIVAAVVLYVVCVAIIAMGFGADAAGGKALASSSGPLFDLTRQYVSSTMAEILEVGVLISGFSAALGTTMGASRLIFAIARDARPGSWLGSVGGSGEPKAAIKLVVAFALGLTIAFKLGGVAGLSAVFYTGTLGTLSLLVAYALVDAGAARLMARGSNRERLLCALPLGGIAVILYLGYNELYPRPPHPYDLFPYIVGGWLLLGLALVVASPGLAARLGKGLVASDELKTSEAESTTPTIAFETGDA